MEKKRYSLVKRETVNVGTAVVAALNILVLLGLFAMSKGNITLLGSSVEVLWPYLQGAWLLISARLHAWWTRKRVSPEATTEPMAEAVLEAKREAMAIPEMPAPKPEAVAAAKRVLNSTT
jgi:hypothetical protein